MKRFLKIMLGVLALSTSTAGACMASTATDGQVTAGHARFTVITPYCVRMEFSPTGQFVDSPSYFAANREARDKSIQVESDETDVVIDTGVIKLTYVNDGKPFSSANLSAVITEAGRNVSW